MSFESVLRTDILSTELSTSRENIQVIVETQFNEIVRNVESKSATPYPAKNINETMELILLAIQDYLERESKTEDAKVNITYDEPNQETDLETISVCIENRTAGAFSKGAPGEGRIHNLKPILREIGDDPDAPGYKRAILGYWYDNILSLTCWARTNKSANNRALWLETMMEEYMWFFRIKGVSRILYQGRGKDITKNISNNIFFGRPVLYYVRTESIRALRQKTLEQIYIKLALDTLSTS